MRIHTVRIRNKQYEITPYLRFIDHNGKKILQQLHVSLTDDERLWLDVDYDPLAMIKDRASQNSHLFSEQNQKITDFSLCF